MNAALGAVFFFMGGGISERSVREIRELFDSFSFVFFRFIGNDIYIYIHKIAAGGGATQREEEKIGDGGGEKHGTCVLHVFFPFALRRGGIKIVGRLSWICRGEGERKVVVAANTKKNSDGEKLRFFFFLIFWIRRLASHRAVPQNGSRWKGSPRPSASFQASISCCSVVGSM